MMDPFYNLGTDEMLIRVFRLSDLGHDAEDIAATLRLPETLVRSMLRDASQSVTPFDETHR